MLEDLAPALTMAAIATVFIVWIGSSAYKRAKEREYSHRERMRALELGLSEIPGAEPAKTNGKKRNYGPGLHAAIWSGVGLGLIGSRALIEGFADTEPALVEFTTFLLIWGMPALFVGLSLGIYAFFQRNKRNGDNGDGGSSR